jgi:hypothetical protein
MASQVNICNLALKRIGATAISAIDEAEKNAEHCNAFWDYILDEVLEDYSWNFAKKTVTLNFTSGFGYYGVAADTKDISASSAADPCEMTVTGHGWSVGHTIYIQDISGMTELNGHVYEIGTAADANTITLLDINSTPMTAYVSGGTGIRMEADPKYSQGYTYDLPTDYLRALHLSDETYQFEILGTGNNRRLLTAASGAILTYTSLEDTTTNLLTRFRSAMGWRLGAELCVPLGKKGAKQEWAMGMYNYVLGKKTTVDARSEKQNLDDSDSWLTDGNFT